MAIATATYIKTEAFYVNFDEGDIKSTFIDIVEDNTIKPILGDVLYANVSGGSPSAEEIVLRDTYVKPLIAYSVKSMVLGNNSPRISNVGATYATVPNGSATPESVEDAHKANETIIQQLKQRLLEYLRDNSTTFNWSEQNNTDFLTNTIFVV